MQQPSPLKERKRIPLIDLRPMSLAWGDDMYKRFFHPIIRESKMRSIMNDWKAKQLAEDPHVFCDHRRNICHPQEYWLGE